MRRTRPIAAASALTATIALTLGASAHATTPTFTWAISPSASPATGGYNELYAVAATPSRAWAVGSSAVGKHESTLIEMHTSSGWTVTPSPNESGANSLYGVAAITKSNAWAVGAHEKDGSFGGGAVLIQHWNGSKWSEVSAPHSVIPKPPGGTTGPGTYALGAITALSKKDIWAVGTVSCESYLCGESPLTEHYNGKKWTAINIAHSTNQADLEGVAALDAHHVWAVGTNYNKSVSTIAGWNGKAWHFIKVPQVGTSDSLFGITAEGSKAIWAVGDYGAKTGGLQPLILQRVKGVWKHIASPKLAHGGSLLSVAALSPTNVWAVGYSATDDDITQPLVEHYNGKKWNVQTSPTVGAFNNVLNGVIPLSATKVYAVGKVSLDDSTNNSQTLVLKGS